MVFGIISSKTMSFSIVVGTNNIPSIFVFDSACRGFGGRHSWVRSACYEIMISCGSVFKEVRDTLGV